MSETTNLKLFKHDNPSINTDQFNIDKALNENWDKIDTGIKEDRDRLSTLEGNIVNLEQAQTTQDEQIKVLQQENAELKQHLDNVLIPRTRRRRDSIFRR